MFQNEILATGFTLPTKILFLPDGRMLVAELDGEIVGLANVGTDELYALYVHPDHWGSRAAQALIERL